MRIAGGAPDAGGTTSPDSGSPSRPGPTGDAGVQGPEPPKPTSVAAYCSLDGHVSDDSTNPTKLDLSLGNGSYEPGQVASAIVLSSTGYAAQRPQMDEAFAFGSKDFTIQAWISVSNVSVGFGTRQLGVSANDGWVLYVNQSAIAFQSNDPRGGLATSLPTSTQFRHVVVRRQAGELTIFVDGSARTSRSDWPSIGPERPFGIQQAQGTPNAPARIDEIVIWSRALSNDEIGAQRMLGASHQPVELDE